MAALQNIPYYSYSDLVRGGVSYNTARSWVKRGHSETIQIGGCKAISVPEAVTRAHVAETRRLYLETLSNSVYTVFKDRLSDLTKEYLDKGYKVKKANHLARVHAVFAGLLSCDGSNWDKYEVLCKYLPGSYKYNTFLQYCSRIRKYGFDDVIGDGRGKRGRSIPAMLDQLIFQMYRDPKKYNKTQVFRRVREFCETYGYKTPSLRWVSSKCVEFENYVLESRYGNSRARQLMPFTSLIHAKNPNTQWQIDGWRIPVYYQENGRYKTLTLVAVMDSFSSAYVGISIVEHENTEAILSALDDAIRNTGYLPAEIVSDNHAFHRTQEAGNLIELLREKGVEWTVDMNPRRKVRLERSFKTLSYQHFKQYPGYLGQGVKSRERSEIPAPEYVDKYTKPGKFLTKDQIQVMAVQCVHEYNNNARQSADKRFSSRMEVYRSTPAVHGVLCDEMTRNFLFVRKVKYTVRNGQITIRRGGNVYEYAFTSDGFMKWNGKEVRVCYADFDRIDVFDMEDNFICSLAPKTKAYAAKADQEGAQTGMLANSAIMKGIRNKSALMQCWLDGMDPEAADRLNPMTNEKDFLQAARESGSISRARLEHPEYLEPVAAGANESYGAVGIIKGWRE